MDLKCFSAPRSAKQQQLAEVQAIEPLLSGVPAAPAFAQRLSPGRRSATNALCPSRAKRSVPVTCSGTESTGGRQPVRRSAGRQPRGAGAGAVRRERCGAVPA